MIPITTVGCDAIGTSASMYPGYFSPQSHACMPPIELADDKANMPDAQILGKQAIVRVDHVSVIVLPARSARLP